MIFSELNNMDKLPLPVVKKAALEKIIEWMPNFKGYNIEIYPEYLDISKPDYVHFIHDGRSIIMLSRRKLNEHSYGKYLLYHPYKQTSLKLSHILC